MNTRLLNFQSSQMRGCRLNPSIRESFPTGRNPQAEENLLNMKQAAALGKRTLFTTLTVHCPTIILLSLLDPLKQKELLSHGETLLEDSVDIEQPGHQSYLMWHVIAVTSSDVLTHYKS